MTDMPNDDLIVIGSRHQAIGALPNGTRIVKINSEPGDSHTDGARGVVRGSLGPFDQPVPEFPNDKYAYFVEWDDLTGIHVLIRQTRIREEDQ